MRIRFSVFMEMKRSRCIIHAWRAGSAGLVIAQCEKQITEIQSGVGVETMGVKWKVTRRPLTPNGSSCVNELARRARGVCTFAKSKKAKLRLARRIREYFFAASTTPRGAAASISRRSPKNKLTTACQCTVPKCSRYAVRPRQMHSRLISGEFY